MTLYEVDGAVFIDGLLASPRLSLALLRQLATRLRASHRLPRHARRASPTLAPHVAPRLRQPEPPLAHPTEFDPRTAGFTADPAVHLAVVREAAAVHWSDAISSYVVTRYDDVHRLTRSRSLVGSITTMDPLDSPDALDLPMASDPPPPRRPGYQMMIRRDGEDHLRLRRLVSKVFTPRAISQWQDRADAIVERLLAAADERAEIDVIADYALPLPAQVISDMLGMPHADQPQLRAWTRALTRGLDPFSSPEEQEASAQAGRGISEHIQQVIIDKRAKPGDDILTALVQAEDAGDVLDDREIVAQVLLLYIAGHETTLNLIGNGMTHLLRFHDQLVQLQAEPGLDANAVEEVLRFESPAQLTRRVSLEPVDVGDFTIPAGSHITLSLASANRDPRKWGPTADSLDIARPGANEHVSFGGGAHFCLGSSLARLEGKAALPRLVRRFPKIAPAYDEPMWLDRVALRGVEALPVTLR
jgi:cytochrome P450